MPIGTDGDGTDDNEGPHCRNCHTGANNCYVCHSDANAAALYGSGTNISAAYTATTTAPVGNQTNYASQSFIRQSAKAGTAVGDPCLDAGFSFPHRTLGANMLKDELFGIDFDGTQIGFGATRTTNGGTLTASSTTNVAAAGEWEYWIGEDRNATSIIPAVRNDVKTLENTAVENMDSVCIDCHGDASYWQGDNPALHVDTTFANSGPDTYGYGGKEGWELLLKGLP